MGLILVVEDEDSVRHAIQMILETSGYSAISAGSCDEALSLISENPPSLIFSDINIPERSGFDLLDELKAAQVCPRVPLVFVSAESTDGDIERGMAAGAKDYVTKPFTPKRLLECVVANLPA
jgi:CheY-like chemotaxis protein